jgi:hypothetical protein
MYQKHKELCEDEGLLVSFGDMKGDNATAEGELQEMKQAFILWYQVFYDDPTIKTWEELEMANGIEEFEDGIDFPADPLDELKPHEDEKKKAKEQEEKAQQMDFWQWIQARKHGEV